MLFSLKPGKALAETQQTNIVSTEVDLANGHKIFARVLTGGMTVTPFVLPALISFDAFFGQMTFFNDAFFSVAIPFVGSLLMGVALSQGYLQDAREDRIIAKLGDVAMSKTEVRKAVKSSKKNRILVSSFNIREGVDEDINSWRKSPLSSIPEDKATHTVKHYLIKDKTGIRLEQEVIANNETVWDLSADALVEVYGVQEVKSVEA